MIDLLNDADVFNKFAGLFMIALAVIAYLMKDWWVERLIKIRDGSGKDLFSNLFRAHMKNTTVEKVKRETSLVPLILLGMGLIAIFLL